MAKDYFDCQGEAATYSVAMRRSLNEVRRNKIRHDAAFAVVVFPSIDIINFMILYGKTKVKLQRAYGGCLGVSSR